MLGLLQQSIWMTCFLKIYVLHLWGNVHRRVSWNATTRDSGFRDFFYTNQIDLATLKFKKKYNVENYKKLHSHTGIGF